MRLPAHADTCRLYQDGSRHFGSLELIIWDGCDTDDPDLSLGWGGTSMSEEWYLKIKFEKEFGGSEQVQLCSSKYRCQSAPEGVSAQTAS